MAAKIDFINVTKNFSKGRGVFDISFSIEQNETVGLLGVNGAGKTTTMNLMTGNSFPDYGEILFDGQSFIENRRSVLKKMGYLPEQPPLYQEMSVIAYLNFVADIKRVPFDIREKSIENVMQNTDISHVQNRLVKNLSKGYKQRIGLAQALIADPEILILDEPTVGLDPRQISDFRNLLKNLKKNHTILLSSHILSEVSAICDRSIIIHNGKIISNEKTKHKTKSPDTPFVLRARGNAEQILVCLQNLTCIAEIETKGNNETSFDGIITPFPGTDAKEAVFYTLAENHFPIDELRPAENLEDIFFQLTFEAKDTNSINEEYL